MTAPPTAGPLRGSPSRRACLIMVCTVFAAAWLECRLYDFHLALPTVYFAPGIFLAALYIVDRPARGRMLAAMILAQALGSMATGITPGAAVLTALIIGAQAWVGATALRTLAPDGLEFTSAQAFADLALVAVIVAPLSGVVIELLLVHADRALGGVNPGLVSPALSGKLANLFRSGILVGWIIPHAMGIVLAMPLTIGFATPLRHSQAAWWSRERLLILACNFVATAAIFYSDGRSYLFLICPALVWAGLRLGVRDTASAILVSLMIASIAAAGGHGPAEVLRTDPALRTMFVQLAYLCACGCIMPIAASLELRRRLEADLARSLAFTGQILSNMREVVFRADNQGRLTFLNPAWEQITGYSIAETLGSRGSELLMPDDQIAYAAAWADLVSGVAQERKLELRGRRRDGEIRDIDICLRAFRDAEGQFLGITGTISDMSEHRRYIEGLETSERRFRQLCDTAPIGIVRCDRLGNISYANTMLEKIAMTSLKSLVGMPWLENLDSHSADLTQRLNVAMLTPGAVVEQELSFVDATGVHRWLIVTATGEFDADLLPIGYIAAVNDITARKAAETALASRTTELRLIAENINDMIFRLGLDRTYRYASATVREVMGLDPERLIGTRAFTLVHPDDQHVVDHAFEQFAAGAIRHCTMSFRAMPAFPGADYVWFEANCRVLRDEAGVPHEIVFATRDITERKQMELAIIEARERAEQATLTKSAFIANLSHEIRTPLNGVIGLTELLLDRELDQPSRRYARLIAESGAAMMHLLNDILDISKIDSGRLQLISEEFDLHRCLANALGLMQASAGTKKLDLRLEIAPGVPRLMLGDSLRLRQVLGNLIGNAVKFTEIGHVAVGARRDGRKLEIRVTDTGIGIAADQIATVFEEFVQANSQISRGYGGTGLGLAISRRIAEAMGGTLTLTSQHGSGTCVVLRIPATFSAVQGAAAAAQVGPMPEQPARALRVLVAEDNRTNQIIINGMLQRLGHSAALAETGVDAIAMVEQAAADGAPFDLVLMDLQMPRMDGIEATARLRLQGFDAARLPIIAVTASGYQENIADCLAAGMQDHLTKPMRLADLKAALARLRPGEATADDLMSPPLNSPREITHDN